MIAKRIINLAITASISVCSMATLQVRAEENDFFNNESMMGVYDDELSYAIIGGTGTEDDPYIVDYSLAPYFEEYMLESWKQSKHPENASPKVFPNGYTGLCLTQYQGQYSNGGVWVYSSGGPSVSGNGALRFSKIAYVDGSALQGLYALRQNYNAWLSVVNDIASYAYSNSTVFITSVISILVNHNYSNVGGVALSTVGAGAAAAAAAAAASIAGTLDLLYVVSSSTVSSAYNNSLNLVQISYMSSYNGSWYSNNVSETGWGNHQIYIPSSFYGTGTFHAY